MKTFAGLNAGNLVGGYDDSGIFRDVAGSLFRTGLDDEAAETAEVNVFTLSERFLYYFHELFYCFEYGYFVNAGGFCDFVNDVGF